MESLPREFSLVYFTADWPTNDWPSKYAVVTAHNPEGAVVDAGRNVAADRALELELVDRGLTHFRVTGGAKDGSHVEFGWGIELPSMESAQELSERFGQLAYFWVADGRLFLVDSKTGECQFQAEWKDRWLGGSETTGTCS
jgi:hypothetical protein